MCLTGTETPIFVRQIAGIHMVTTPGERGVGMDIQDVGFVLWRIHLSRTPVI